MRSFSEGTRSRSAFLESNLLSGGRSAQTPKGIPMKISLSRVIQIVFCVLAAVVLLPSAAAQGGRWRDYNMPFPIVSREQAEGLKPGAKIAMACTKCKTVQVREVDLNRGILEWFTPNVKHVCPGCGGNWSWVTYGRSPRHGDWVHTCSKCGDKSMYCCSTESGKKTKGM